MTHFEEAAQSIENMSVTIAFCVATYLKEIGVEGTDDEMKDFISKISPDIQTWLEEEIPDPKIPPKKKKSNIILLS